MKKYNLLEADLNEDANDALQDFESHLSHLTDLKSKAGDAWSMTIVQGIHLLISLASHERIYFS